MKIERLTLHGFKSFAERTELLFDNGVTGIIGPNGSGKSNIVEAVRFVMGSRARALRAREAEALIFHGGAGTRPMPFAEVELVVRNQKQRFVVRRRIDRSGNQEVTLNGKRATFRQIERALAGSGLGKSSHALVGQGEISSILESGPDALLERLEEAAGLRVVTLALRETKQRLERAQRHLDQLNEQLAGKLAEVARLRAEAEEARRAEELQSELAAVRRGLFYARRSALKSEIKKLEEKIAALESERDGLQALAADEAERQEKLEARIHELADEVSRLQAVHAEKEGSLRLLQQELAHLEENLGRLRRERKNLEGEAAELEALSPPEKPQPPAGLPAREKINTRLEELNEEVRALKKTLAELEQELSRKRRAHREYLEARSRYEAIMAEREAQEKQRKDLNDALAQLSARLAAAKQKYAAASARENELKKRRDSLSKRLNELTARLQGLEAEARRLAGVIAAGKDLAEGPRRVVKASLPGVIGVVADLVEVPAGLEVAAEASLGPRLQWVLTKTEEAVRRGVELLKQRGGRATFLAEEMARPRVSDLSEFLQYEGVVGAARELFAIPNHRKLTDALFGDTLVVADLATALELARKKRRVRMVTLAGEVIEPLGSVSGGRKGRGGSERIALRNRLRELEEEKSSLKPQLDESRAELAKVKAALERIDAGKLKAELDGLIAEEKALRRALAALPALEPPEPPKPVPEPDETPLQEVLQRLEALGTEQAGLQEKLSAWDAYQQALERYQLEKRFYEERREKLAAIAGRLQEIAAEEKRTLERRDGLRKQLEAVRRELAEIGLEEARKAYVQARKQLDELKQERQRHLQEVSRVITELDGARVLLARRSATLEEVEREGSQLPPGPNAEGSVRKLQMRLREIEREIEAIGPVNHRAAATLAEMEEKLGGLEAAAREAEEAAARLRAESEELRAVYDSQLHDAYKTFRSRFAYYGRALLGGNADVTLHEEGLKLLVQPAGKRTRDLGLLSMGEKSMGALAFIFALAEVGEGSLPIAVLDEVDAPLDESNILRYTEFLRRFAAERQYILVTHQKRSMEACDVLWGVTSSNGSSRVYSLRREEVNV